MLDIVYTFVDVCKDSAPCIYLYYIIVLYYVEAATFNHFLGVARCATSCLQAMVMFVCVCKCECLCVFLCVSVCVVVFRTATPVGDLCGNAAALNKYVLLCQICAVVCLMVIC